MFNQNESKFIACLVGKRSWFFNKNTVVFNYKGNEVNVVFLPSEIDNLNLFHYDVCNVVYTKKSVGKYDMVRTDRDITVNAKEYKALTKGGLDFITNVLGDKAVIRVTAWYKRGRSLSQFPVVVSFKFE